MVKSVSRYTPQLVAMSPQPNWYAVIRVQEGFERRSGARLTADRDGLTSP